MSAVGLGLGGCSEPDPTTLHDDRPDIVVLVLDSLRAQSLPMYGHPRNTAPFLADLAARSTLFEHCFAAATWTRPSVTSILTGVPPLEHRGWRFNRAFPSDRPSFPRFLGKSGYQTGFFTANPAIGREFGMEAHFDQVSTTAAQQSDFGPRLTHDCISWVRSLRDNLPVFVYIHYFPPHGPYCPPEDFLRRAHKQPSGDTHQLPHRYRGRVGISLAAGILGRIPWYQAKFDLGADPLDYRLRYEANVAYADSLAEGFFTEWGGLRRRTRRCVFIVTGDHGEGLGEHDLLFDHGWVLIDEILHVPLLLHDTEDPHRSRVEHPVSHLDLAPTVLELAQTPRSLGTMSSSLFAESSPTRIVLSQQGVERGESAWALTSDRWRLVYNGGAAFGGKHLMSVQSGDQTRPTVTATPVAHSPTVLPEPQEIADDMVLESLAFHDRALLRGEKYRFSGTLRAGDSNARLALRVRAPGLPTVNLGVFGSGEFEGERNGLSDDDGGKPEFVFVEGRPLAGPGLGLQAGVWQCLLKIPVLSPRSLTGEVALLGGVVEPGLACPGDAIRVLLYWRTDENIAAKNGYLVELVGPRKGIVIREARPFCGEAPQNDEGLKPLVEQENLRYRPFSRSFFDFEDAFWLDLPPELEPGTYRLRVGGLDYGRFLHEGQIVTPAEPIHAATMEITTSRSECLRLHGRRELGIEDLRVPPDFRPRKADKGMIEALTARFPRHGHFDYLLSATSRDEGARRTGLSRCVEKSPYHVQALLELASLGDDEATKTLEQLTPSHPCSVSFGGIIRLAGFDLCRGESCIYLTLYWDAEASSAAVFSANLLTRMRQTSGVTTDRWIWWFLGGSQRPTDSWRIGERVIDTVRVETEPDSSTLSFKLALLERWRMQASNNRGRFVVTAGNGAKKSTVRADLGTHRLDHLPCPEPDARVLKRSDPDQCVLIDLQGDPEQRRDVKGEQPEIFSRLHQQLGTLLKASDSWGQGPQGRAVELSEETADQLKALGYIDKARQ